MIIRRVSGSFSQFLENSIENFEKPTGQSTAAGPFGIDKCGCAILLDQYFYAKSRSRNNKKKKNEKINVKQ